MPEKSPFEKLQETVAAAVRGVAADPGAAAGKAAGQVRGLMSLGLTVVGQVAQTVAERLTQESPPPSAPGRPVSPPERGDTPSPADVAKVVEMKPKPPAKKAAKKAPAKKATPSARLPAKKTAPAKKATPAKKAAAKKAPAKKAPAKKTPTPPPSAAEALEDTDATTPVGTTGADVGTNPSTTETDLQQPGTEPLMDPATTKAVASEAETGARAADPEKG